jgi:DNA-binding transcriptional regulator GbsR (MarR family)
MKNQDIKKLDLSRTTLKQFRELSNSIGDFIRYWGFRRIHGAIWTQLYLSEYPRSGTDLVESLDVSKALISSALAELEEWKLIFQIPTDNAKTKHYAAEKDVIKVIRYVIENRELKIIEKIQSEFERFEKVVGSNEGIDIKKMKDVKEMILFAQVGLQMVQQLNDIKDVNWGEVKEVIP